MLSTGDTLSHDFKDEFIKAGGADGEYAGFVIKTMRFVDRMLQQSFPGVPLISALGNNDSTCDDYALAPNDPMLAPVGRGLRVVARNPRRCAITRWADPTRCRTRRCPSTTWSC